MSLIEQLNNDIKAAMKQKDKLKLSVIRMVKSALQNETIEKKKDLNDDEALTVLNRELKQRKDSLQEFEAAGRDDLVEKTKSEIQILQDYMPTQLSEEEVVQLVKETIAEVGAASKAEMGKVMSAIMPKVKGRADGKLVNQMVKEQLN